jgi:hypothetical protein
VFWTLDDFCCESIYQKSTQNPAVLKRLIIELIVLYFCLKFEFQSAWREIEMIKRKLFQTKRSLVFNFGTIMFRVNPLMHTGMRQDTFSWIITTFKMYFEQKNVTNFFENVFRGILLSSEMKKTCQKEDPSCQLF